MAKQFHDKAEKLKLGSEKYEENLTYLKMVQYETEKYIASFELQAYLLPPVSFRSGFQSVIPSLFDDEKDLR